MTYISFVMLLCFAIAVKLCVVLTHEEDLCVDNPDCFSLLIKQHDTLQLTIAKQLTVSQMQLQLQTEQLRLLREFNSRNSFLSQLGVSLVNNLVYLATLGLSAVIIPWVYRKLIAIRKIRSRNQFERELAATIIRAAWSRAHGGELSTSGQQDTAVDRDIPLAEKMGTTSGISRLFEITSSAGTSRDMTSSSSEEVV